MQVINDYEITAYRVATSGSYDNVVYVENEYPYIKYAYDKPAVYNINGYQTLVLPGAYSVDKYVRLQNGWSWFEQELPTEEEMNDGIKICEEKNNKFDFGWYKKYGKIVSLMGCRASLSPWYIKGGMSPADNSDYPEFVGRCNLGRRLCPAI